MTVEHRKLLRERLLQNKIVMKNAYIIFAVIAFLSVSSCVDNTLTETYFVSSYGDVGLTVNGKVTLSYKAGFHQCSYNDEKAVFRISDDTFNNYFIVDCKGKIPSAPGESVAATLTYTTIDDTPRTQCTFSVSKISGDKIWLWDDSKKIGAVVRLLR